VADICRKAGMSQRTYFSWRKKYAGLLQRLMNPTGSAVEDQFNWLGG
jgi:hypothetical protein